MENLVLKNIVGLIAVIIFFSGLLLLLCPEFLKRLNDYMDRWISVRQFLKPLEIIIKVDDQIYKMRKILAIISLVLVPILIYWYINL